MNQTRLHLVEFRRDADALLGVDPSRVRQGLLGIGETALQERGHAAGHMGVADQPGVAMLPGQGEAEGIVELGPVPPLIPVVYGFQMGLVRQGADDTGGFAHLQGQQQVPHLEIHARHRGPVPRPCTAAQQTSSFSRSATGTSDSVRVTKP